jgi:thioredoxin reductase (NADPH)
LIHTDISILGKTEGKVIGIVGAGDAAFDYSLTLTGNGNEVLIFNRGKRIRALKTLRDKVLNHEKIRYFEDMSIESFILQPDHGFQAIGHHASSKQDFYLDYLIFATGRDPALHFLDQNILANKEQLQERHLLYEIGDVHNRDFRQLSLAVGDGIRAAMEIYRNESNQ